jgi:multifunctional methyltransferase subunit TRM112
MRFLTHNSLRCNLKDSQSELPFQLEVLDMEIIESECDYDFIRHILPSLDWVGINIAAKSIKLEGMPETFDSTLLDDEDFLQAVHYLLLDVHVISGFLICQETGIKFPIENKVPILM